MKGTHTFIIMKCVARALNGIRRYPTIPAPVNVSLNRKTEKQKNRPKQKTPFLATPATTVAPPHTSSNCEAKTNEHMSLRNTTN